MQQPMQPSIQPMQKQPQPQPQPPIVLQPKTPIDVALSESMMLIRKSLSGLKSATVASSDTVEARVASDLQANLAEQDATMKTRSGV